MRRWIAAGFAVLFAGCLVWAVRADEDGGITLGGGIVPGQPWVDDGSTLYPGSDRDVDLSDDTPHVTMRDSDDNEAVQLHLDSGSGAAPYQGWSLWGGSQAAAGAAFSVNPNKPVVRVGTTGSLFFDNLNVGAARCVELTATGQVSLASAACGSGGGGNSFETIAVPAGTNPVADSATDTLTVTETSFLTITGTAGTDTIDITQVTTDLGTDGLIAANAVALGTDTTNAYVTDLTAGTYIDVSGGGAETATVTVDVDATEIEAVTFGAGGNASNAWTVNLSGTDPVMTWASDAIQFNAEDVEVQGAGPNLILNPDSGDSFGFHVDPSISVAFFNNTTDGARYLQFSGDHSMHYGLSLVPYHRFEATTTGNAGVRLPDDSIGVAELDTADSPADGETITYQGSSGRMVWSAAAGSGDITAVGDVADGAAFNGSQGTTLTFEGDAGADFTLSYNTTTDDFHVTDDLNIYQSSPSLVFRDTTDDVAYSLHIDTAALHYFELFRGTDSGTGFNQTARLLSFDSNNALHLPQTTSCDTLDTDGAGKVACGSDAGDVKEYWWPCAAMLPLEAADSIPPLTKDAGTALDQLACGFDADADEGRTIVFKVPSDVDTTKRVTFRAYSYSAAATTGNFVLDFRHNGGVADGVDPDQTLTTEANSPDTTAGTAGQVNVTTWTESASTMGWAANDLVYGVLYRDANNSGDTLAGDLLIIGFSVEIPRS